MLPMMRAQTLELDDRRELWRLLDRLKAVDRIRFVEWCCKQVRGKGKLGVTHHSGKTGEAYADLIHLEVVFGLDLNAAACRLERFVRKGR